MQQAGQGMQKAEERALLGPLRERIDSVDSRIAALLAERFAIVRKVAAVKAEHGIAPVLPDRIAEVVGRARTKADAAGFDPDVAEQIYRILIDAACRLEENFVLAQERQEK
jgi:isochorismate pyruvate lyase